MIWLLLAGCGTPEAAPGSNVLAPDDVSALWDESYAEADEIGGGKRAVEACQVRLSHHGRRKIDAAE